MEYYAKSENSQGASGDGKRSICKRSLRLRGNTGKRLGLQMPQNWGHMYMILENIPGVSGCVKKGTRTGVDHAISSACFLECCYSTGLLRH